MTERIQTPDTLPADLSIEDWTSYIVEGKGVAEIPVTELRAFFEAHGAKLEISEKGKRSLKKYSNKGSRTGMDAVWGEGRVNKVKAWLRDWIAAYGETQELTMPYLEKSKVETSGALQVWHELTALAVGLPTHWPGLVKSRLEVRTDNFEAKQEGRKRAKMFVYDGDKLQLTRISSCPREFVGALLAKLSEEQ